MRIYVAHSKNCDYKNELYLPIRQMKLNEDNEIILPHENSDGSSNTREFYKEIDLFIAECSYPATGLGIELGWAYDDHRPIYCIYKKGSKLSGSIRAVTNNIFEYTDVVDMVDIIGSIIELESKKRKKHIIRHDT